ncbi:type II secretion system F family protein [bacterium AH-315-I18]|nr:type II secretion system F family protein [bacterium AH-315-I18]
MSTLMTLQYRAQTADGEQLVGSLEALDVNTAREQLVSLGLTVLEMQPVKSPLISFPRRAVSGADLQMFNQQLVNLAQSGLPVEEGLRLIAQDISSKKLKVAVGQVIEDLDKGRSLAEAFDSQKKFFPPMYASLVEVGTRTGKLPGVLFNLGQHLQMVGQLKNSLYRACAYPLIVFVFFMAIMTFMSFVIGPAFDKIFQDFDTELPSLTVLVLGLFRYGVVILPVMIVASIGLAVCLGILRLTSWWCRVTDLLMNGVPLIGAILRRSAVARWSDAVRMGVDASMDLPTAMGLASDLIHSPTITKDTQKVISCVEEGRPLASIKSLSVLPTTLLATIELAENAQSLVSSLEDLSSMYRQQAYLRSVSLEMLLGPLLLIVVAVGIGFSALAMFLPLVKLMTQLT